MAFAQRTKSDREALIDGFVHPDRSTTRRFQERLNKAHVLERRTEEYTAEQVRLLKTRIRELEALIELKQERIDTLESLIKPHRLKPESNGSEDQTSSTPPTANGNSRKAI
jgi:hypothetical protein